MDILDEELVKIIRTFNAFDVKYMLVGGFAVSYYGYSRTTADFDLWVKPSNQNRDNIMTSLLALGHTKEEIEELSTQDFSQPVSFQLGGNHFYIDVMTFISGVNFDEAFELAVQETVNSEDPLRIIHRNHLIVNKQLTGRTKDKLDVESLQHIQKVNPK
jgi:hypothetical protein